MSEMISSRVSARGADAPALDKPAAAVAVEHKHPTGYCDQIVGFDDRGMRIINQVPARTPTYLFSCKACQADDKRRMSVPSKLLPSEIDRTLFLVPEDDYAGLVARAYVQQRYGDVPHMVCAFHAERLSYVKGSQIVVVTRRGKDGRAPGSAWKRQKDAEDIWQETKIPPETYVDECVESEPIVVADCMDVVPATMFTEGNVNMSELVARLAERAAPFRIALPADPRDKMYTMRLHS
jgi:hypothetical protein